MAKAQSKSHSGGDAALRAAVSDVGAGPLTELTQVDGQKVYRIETDGKSAIGLWEKLRKVVDKAGYWPIVMGRNDGPWSVEGLEETVKDVANWVKALKKETGRTYDKKLGVTGMLLQAGLDLDSEAWLKKNRLPDTTEDDDEWAMMAAEEGETIPKSKPNKIFRGVIESLSNKPLKKTSVTLWPTREGWQVPALMRYGGWNACPMPHVQVMLLRRWKEKYDAELVVVAGDIVEMRVGRPPKTDGAALELAREQYSYCDDIVIQGTMTLERLAECLKGGTVWYFWWD